MYHVNYLILYYTNIKYVVNASISNLENNVHVYYQKSPGKNKYSSFLESNTTTETWSIHPTVIPFLTPMTVKKSKKKDGRLELRPYYNAAVNHNILENKKVSEIIHTCLDEFYHDNETKVAQLDTLGNDACILIGVDQIVSAYYYYYYFVSFNLPIIFRPL